MVCAKLYKILYNEDIGVLCGRSFQSVAERCAAVNKCEHCGLSRMSKRERTCTFSKEVSYTSCAFLQSYNDICPK